MSDAIHAFRFAGCAGLIVKDGTASSHAFAEMMSPVPDELASERMTMLGGLMVLDLPHRRVLVDAGNPPWSRDRKHVATSVLECRGIASGSVDLVLVTHGDPDHIGGLLTTEGRLAYPQAKYVAHRALGSAWETMDRSKFFPGQRAFIQTLEPLLRDRVQWIEKETEVAPGVLAIPSLGHRCGHTSYLFRSEGEALLHAGDAAFHPALLEHLDSVNPRDADPDAARGTRRALVQRAARDSALVTASHFRLPALGRLVGDARRPRWVWV